MNDPICSIGQRVYTWNELDRLTYRDTYPNFVISEDRTHVLEFNTDQDMYFIVSGKGEKTEDRDGGAKYYELTFNHPERKITIEATELPDGLHVYEDQIVITEGFYLQMKELFEQ
jgi:hypothetical protein